MMTMVRRTRTIAVVFAVVYLTICCALLVVMRRPLVFGRVMRHVPDPAMAVVPFKQLWFVARAGRLRVGELAPDFSLSTADRNSSISLASLRGQRPVVLIFGSYT